MPAFISPNLFQVQGGGVHVSYSTTGIDGKPHFHYQDTAHSLNFSGGEIRIVATEIATLVTVTIRITVDSGSTSFSLLIPTVNMHAGETIPIRTIGITTVHRLSLVPILNVGQTELYSETLLSGTAQHVAF
jgi:hypothetical protein